MVLVYDSGCGFCEAAALWIRGESDMKLNVLASADLGENSLITAADVTKQAYLLDEDGLIVGSGATAILVALSESSWRWRFVKLFSHRPFVWASTVIYRWVAKSRGKYTHCKL